MPTLRNPCHERFVQGHAKGLTGKGAYIEAGYRSRGHVAEAEASKLLRNSKIRARLAELQARQVKRLDITVENLVDELEQMGRAALANKQITAGVSAIMGKAKLLGLVVDRAEVEGTLRRPLREPSERARSAERVVAFYNKRGTCEQWIREGKAAINWMRLSCRTFAANAVRLQLNALAYNLGNFLRTLATPEPIKDWSLTSLKEKLIKIGAKVVSHGRYVAFQMAEVAIPRQMFQEILRLIAELRPQPPPAPA
jgi:hypothetical protein